MVAVLSVVASQQAWALSNSLTLINLTGGITNYTGTGIRLGQVEAIRGVPNTNHVFLQGQVVFTTNFSVFGSAAGVSNAHGTEVAGVMVSTSSVFRGVAPGGSLSSAGISNVAEAISAAWFLATNQNARVINESANIHANAPTVHPETTGTSTWERALDRLVSQTGVTFVNSAGNDGAVATSVAIPAGAYNVIAVGAVSNVAPGTAATNVASFSSRGPLSDGRNKPDIVAPGARVIMPTHPIGGAGTAVATNDGTSFAAPHVAGVAARLVEAAASNAFPNATPAQGSDPRVIKAGLLNSATKLPGWTQGSAVAGGVTTITAPLDNNQGAGLLNAGAAYDQLTAGRHIPTLTNSIATGAGAVNLKGFDLFTVNFGLTNIYQVAQQSSGSLALTVTWNRDVGGGPGFADLGLANLDLLLWSGPDTASATNLIARSVSLSNNVEHIYLTGLTAAYYQFGIFYTNYWVAGGPANPPITYGLAWSFAGVPEPSLLGLCALGVGVLMWFRRGRSPAG